MHWGFGSRGMFLTQLKLNRMEKERLLNFLIDDLKKLEKNIEVLVDMINTTHLHYSDTKKPLENIDNFISYWKQHSNKLNK